MKCPEDHEMVLTYIEHIGKKPSKECWYCHTCDTEFQITYARVGADELQGLVNILDKDRDGVA